MTAASIAAGKAGGYARYLESKTIEPELEAGLDPREELIFRGHLLDYAAQLRQEGGGVARAWKPGPPPDEWAGAR